MRFLQITDTHVTAKSPNSRQDVYYETVLNKFKELGRVIEQNEIDVVIHTGDLFHTSRVSLKMASQLVEIIRSWDAKMYVVPGNHDIDGYNISTLDQTMLGMLSSAGVIELLTRDNPQTFFEDGYEIRLEGQEYYEDIDKDSYKDYRMDETKDYNILAIHSMLLDQPFFPDIPHTLIKDVTTTADMVLSGHYHKGFKEEYVNHTWFFNPGSLLRVEIDNREPKFLVFDVELDEETNEFGMTYWQYGTLSSSKQSNQVFDFNAHKQKQNKQHTLQSFKAQVAQATALAPFQNPIQLLDQVGQAMNLKQSVIETAKDGIKQIQGQLNTSNQSLKGYVTKTMPIRLTKLEIKNFQSHVHTVLEFDDKMNVIVGETNSGKSAILRALRWCLYNEPKGNDFIRTGANQVSVTCTFSDHTVIERKRSKSSAGQYIITKPDGTQETFQGFAHDVPALVAETHQMPEVSLTKDIKAKLNFTTQLEGPFLISESPQTRAGVIGRIAGTQEMDLAIKELNKQSLSATKEIKLLDQQIGEWNLQLFPYQDLEQKKQEIDLLTLMIKDAERLEALTKQLEQLSLAEAKLQEEKIKQETLLATYPDLSELNVVIKGIDETVKHLEICKTLFEKNSSVEYKLQTVEVLLNEPVINLQEVNQAVTLFQKVTAIQNTLEKYETLDHQQLVVTEHLKRLPYLQEENLSNIETLMQELKHMQELLEEESKWKHHLASVNEQINDDTIVICDYNDQITSLKEELKGQACPCCGRVLDEEQVEHFVESEEEMNGH